MVTYHGHLDLLRCQCYNFFQNFDSYKTKYFHVEIFVALSNIILTLYQPTNKVLNQFY